MRSTNVGETWKQLWRLPNSVAPWNWRYGRRVSGTRLKRDVAIKVLPDAFAKDADRLARFQREAEVLATLNHSNIAAIYGLEKADGTTGIILELVEGKTLADLIARGPIPISDALPIARQVADALEAAHDKGVVHRDLK